MDTNNVDMGPLYKNEIKGSLAWKRDNLTTSNWKVKLPDPVLDELHNLISFLRVNPTPLEVLEPRDFDLEASYRFMQKIQNLIANGPGLAVVSKLPTEKFNKDELKQIYWVLSSMIARPVA